MNYTWTVPALVSTSNPYAQFWTLDFLQSEWRCLDELCLSEPAGLWSFSAKQFVPIDFVGPGGGALDIAAVDLFANNTSSIYYDDVAFEPLEACDTNGDTITVCRAGLFRGNCLHTRRLGRRQGDYFLSD